MKEWIIANTDVTDEEYDSHLKEDRYSPNDADFYSNPLINIHAFTLRKPNLFRLKAYNIKKNDGKYDYKGIKFQLVSEEIKLPKELIQELYSPNRYGKCLDYSVNINIPDTKIMTLLCHDIFKNHRPHFLHSVILVELESGEIVIDATGNFIMRKDDFIRLFDAKVMSVLTRDEIYNSIRQLHENGLYDEVSTAELLCFYDQIMKANKMQLKKDE